MSSAASLGVRVWTGTAVPMRKEHQHADVELNFVTQGWMRYFLAGHFPTVRPGRLAVFWAGLPHQLVDTAPKTRVIWVTLPLAWFMQWGPGGELARRLLAGEFIEERDAAAAALDGPMLERWLGDFRDPAGDARGTALLEIEARMRRLARTLRPPWRPAAAQQRQASGAPLERVTRFIGERYTEPLSVARIAGAAGWNPNYLMTLFRRECGMTVWEYVLRLRVAHAQRLLLTTDRKMLDIALDSGFASASRFYEAFRRYCGGSPRRYRAAGDARLDQVAKRGEKRLER